jgi:glycosyltransferase involved in cell wall biosynthesis
MICGRETMGNSAGIGAMKLPAGDGRQLKAPFKPLISVVTVVFNGEHHLTQTINSVIEQNYKEIELIVIDGGSSDGTVNIIKKNERFITHWVSEPDGGIYDAMNKAIKLCKGEYLYFLNCADHFADPDTLEEVARHLRSKRPDILCGYVLYSYEDGLRVNSIQINSEYDLYRETICHQALFTARHLFDTVGMFDKSYRISADREWLLRALKIYNYKICYIDVPVCVYDIAGVSSRQRMRLRLENIKINHKYFKWRFYPFFLKQLVNKIRLLAASSR